VSSKHNAYRLKDRKKDVIWAIDTGGEKTTTKRRRGKKRSAVRG